MSYARNNGRDSNVYVIRHISGCLHCYCEMDGNCVQTPQEMQTHLEAHRSRGDLVPQYTMDRLAKEIAEEADVL